MVEPLPVLLKDWLPDETPIRSAIDALNFLASSRSQGEVHYDRLGGDFSLCPGKVPEGLALPSARKDRGHGMLFILTDLHAYR